MSSTTIINCETPASPPPPGSGNGGGGNTTPNPPGGYDPCDGEALLISSIKKHNGFSLSIVPPSPCDDEPQVPFNEFVPFDLPNDFGITDYPEEWAANEDEFAVSNSLILQQGINKFDPIPEIYYITSTPINMANASPSQGYTVKGAPRNYNYFWKQLAIQRPEMFSQANRVLLKASRAPNVDAQWIKYNPTHLPYLNDKLIHHHDQQGYLAYAVPNKVHTKWHARLHAFRTGGKIGGLGGKLLSIGSVLQNVFTHFSGFITGDPDAWINWFGSNKNEIGKIYYHVEKDVYFEIINKQEFKNSSGKVIRAIVTYDVYQENVWDSDENRYMGVMKLARFTEDVDLVNKTSTDATLTYM